MNFEQPRSDVDDLFPVIFLEGKLSYACALINYDLIMLS